MKKKMIALLLSIALAAGSIGTAPVYAMETTTEEAVAVEEEADLEEEAPEETEDSDTRITAETVTEDETAIAEEMPAQETKDITEEEETAEEQYESDDDTETTEMADDPEEAVTESSKEGDTFVEIVEIEEQDVIEEEVIAAEANEAKLANSGKCGTNATWSISGTTLTISGSGAINDYSYIYEFYWPSDSDDIEDAYYIEYNNTPWYGREITRIIIKEGITTIGSAAFAGLGNLKSITIPSSVKNIGHSVFRNCKSLTNITIPYGVPIICGSLFSGCSSLSNVTLPSTIKSIQGSAFSGCNNLTSISIPNSVTSIGESAFYDCNSLTGLIIPNGVKSIPKSTFYGCSSLKSIEIPDGVTKIGDKAFYDCNSLTSVMIPDSVVSVGSYVFYRCSSLTNVRLSNGLKRIGPTMFNSCSSLASITIPDGVTSIMSDAFAGCHSLENISIPSSMKGIGDNAFLGCDSMNVYFNGTKSQWSAIRQSDLVHYRTIIFAVDSGTFSVDADFQLPKTAYNYTGNPVMPVVNVTYNGNQLVQDKDYTLTYENNINIGTATVNVNGIGDYSGTAKLQYRIRLGNPPKVTCTNVASGMKVSWEKVSGATRYKVYRDGKLIFTTSALVVTDKEVKYKGGTKFVYKVVATEKNTGDSDLFKTATYYRLMPVGIKSLTNLSAGKMTVTYDKSAGCYGYVVRYGLNSDMSDAKVITVSGANTTSRTFGGMKKGKTYYVQVRTYMLDNGVRYYSGYCTTKTITIKK